MDSWSAIQLKKMQCGGNEQLNDIMQQYGLSKHTPIKEKYFSKVAEVGWSGVRCNVRSNYDDITQSPATGWRIRGV